MSRSGFSSILWETPKAGVSLEARATLPRGALRLRARKAKTRLRQWYTAMRLGLSSDLRHDVGNLGSIEFGVRLRYHH